MTLDTYWQPGHLAYYEQHGRRCGVVQILDVRLSATGNVYRVGAGTRIINWKAKEPARSELLYPEGATFDAHYHELVPIRGDV